MQHLSFIVALAIFLIFFGNSIASNYCTAEQASWAKSAESVMKTIENGSKNQINDFIHKAI